MKKIVHESAKYHVTGEAVYIDDMLVNEQCLHGVLYTSPIAHGKIKSYDLSAAKALSGIHAILTYKDIPGHNQMGPIFHDEVVLAEDKVEFIGQAIFLIAAENEEIAEEAKRLIKIEFEELEPVLTIEKSMELGNLIQPPRKIETGNIEEAFKSAKNIIEDILYVGGQEHWYLETQTALCFPGEGQEIKVYSSTQNPSEIQAIVSEVLGISKMQVEVDMRRMGGGFGGKESEANHIAAWTAILAVNTKRPVKMRFFRDEDQKITGKRHRFLLKYKAAFDNDGIISAIDVEQSTDAGWATDLTMSILERAMMHAENSYYIPNMRIIGNAWRTNLPSNTAYRGFGGPQGMAGMETIIDRIARKLKIDAAEIRFRNFMGMEERNTTPYGQKVENNRLFMLWEQIRKTSDYQNRRKKVDEFNAKNEFVKRGLALTPIKFGISFTTSFLNQAGALVHVYNDGTVLVSHGGTEMGQGLNTKIKQVAALEFGIDYDKVRVNSTNTARVPNTSPTAASSGTDMNGMAVKNAVDILKSRISEFIAKKFNIENADSKSKIENIVFENDTVFDIQNTNRRISFKDAVSASYLGRVSLSSTGFYKTPGVHFDRAKGTGNPFFYFAFGMSVSEIELDVLTGRTKFLRADILHDVGESINPDIDKGQVEGAFIQGVGWVTTEEMKYDGKGNLLNHSPDTYKIPSIQDIPEIFNVNLLQNAPNPNTIRRSKAVGEPPFMLAFSTWLAIKDAISAVTNHEIEPEFRIPATNENILLAIEKIKRF
ncbi:MAG TPA: xanthine dehydrogenase molybdopterin binding subunit [Bacteroidales bacterium]|nr:MAG: xanthine dehydrogenase molybdopterin binding subunit [Bacteroidetes bacterium GWF2_33_38]OFY86219.1 MAG: xanthine dehydrogenase molybdopterin binding subunit [Bacteroidetes bacterium RIFOXYA2_FULL_33_7]HBF89224.1 xanthine dehydrogenase molybdopterin binding subunit [Bacteroidales bacterium]